MHLTERQKQVIFQPIRVAINGWAFSNAAGLQVRIARAEAEIAKLHCALRPFADELLMPLRAEMFNLKSKTYPKVARQYPVNQTASIDDRILSKRRA
jgi:hypothetical protein